MVSATIFHLRLPVLSAVPPPYREARSRQRSCRPEIYLGSCAYGPGIADCPGLHPS